MNEFALDARLRADCHVLGRLPLCEVLLLNRAEVPWFILVPRTTPIDLCDLTAAEQGQLLGEVSQLSRVIRQHFAATKLNVAAIGNRVAQLHVHVIGRRTDDPWWPGVVWGQPSSKTYADARVAAIRTLLSAELGAAFTAV